MDANKLSAFQAEYGRLGGNCVDRDWNAWSAGWDAHKKRAPVTAEPVVPAGWKLVPVEPTTEMAQAILYNPVRIGSIEWPANVSPNWALEAYRALVAAAPPVSTAAAEDAKRLTYEVVQRVVVGFCAAREWVEPTDDGSMYAIHEDSLPEFADALRAAFDASRGRGES